MATQFQFNGKTITIPGSYGNIKSGIKNPSIALPFGNLLIIETGSGTGFGGGAGVAGTLASGTGAIYEFDNIQDFQTFQKGGLWWFLGKPLYQPNGPSSVGVSKVFWMKAALTTPASWAINFYGDGHQSLSQHGGRNGGTLNIQCTDEGVVGNGVMNNSTNQLVQGYGVKMTAGTINTSAFVLNFYVGTYKGLDQNGLPFDGVYSQYAQPQLVIQSPEFTNISTLITWMNTNSLFLKNFKLASSTVIGTGAVDKYDLADYAYFTPAVGGTENYGTGLTYLNQCLTAATDMLVNFVLSDQYGSNAQSATNVALASYVINQNKYNPELYVGGGDDVNTFTTNPGSLADAVFFNQDSVTLTHGAVTLQSKLGLRTYSSIYIAANLLGREAGLEPQVPLTFKNITIDGLTHKMNTQEQTKCLNSGVLAVILDAGNFECLKGVNTLQNNSFLINDDGTIPSKQLKRIARQVNNTLIVNSKAELLKDPNGVNRNTLSDTDIQQWTAKQLKAMIAVPGEDNLILSFDSNIVVTRQQDAWKIQYKFTPNSEISVLLFSGLVIGV